MTLSEKLNQLVNRGELLAPKGGTIGFRYNGELQHEYVAWRYEAIFTIEQLGKQGTRLIKDIESDQYGAYFYKQSASNIMGALKAAVALAEHLQTSNEVSKSFSGEKNMSSKVDDKAFLVHGHDHVLLNQVNIFLTKLEIQPVILFEEPGKGQTIIEKLESNSDVSYAIILFTPDDLGKTAVEEGELKPRARQNVILELGFFLGKLGRANVAVLYDPTIELPSDYRGVEYIEIDVGGAWKLKLGKEMKAAGLKVDMNKAIT